MILTKLDGDTRGGAALSIRAVTGKPILYVGMGEKLSDLEQFYPDRMASVSYTHLAPKQAISPKPY